MVVVFPPVFEGQARILQAGELMEIQAVLPELAIEAFHEGVLGGFARLDKMELHASALRPEEHRLSGQLGAVVRHDLLR